MKYRNIIALVVLGLLVACVRPTENHSSNHNSTTTLVTHASRDTLTSPTQPAMTGQPTPLPESATRQASVIQQISVQELATLIESATENYLLLDVREPWEYQQGHVAGAQLIPLGQLQARVDEISDEQNIYVICRSGNRSMSASRILQAAGKRNIHNVQGGIIAWQQASLAVERGEP